VWIRTGETRDALRVAEFLGPFSPGQSILEGVLQDGHRFVQYRVEMEIPDPADTPEATDLLTRLNEVRIEFYEVFDDALEPDGNALSSTISPDPKPWAWGTVNYTA